MYCWDHIEDSLSKGLNPTVSTGGSRTSTYPDVVNGEEEELDESTESCIVGKFLSVIKRGVEMNFEIVPKVKLESSTLRFPER